MKTAVIIVATVIVLMVAVFKIITELFRRCKHPEKWATFDRNIYGDEINYVNGRSWWKAKWWPFGLVHHSLYECNP